MSRICQITGKKTASGNNRPWSKKATKRTFKVNLMKKKILMGGKLVTMRVSAKGLKTLKKQMSKA